LPHENGDCFHRQGRGGGSGKSVAQHVRHTGIYFGSAAKGGLRPGPDVDMAVTGLPSQVYFSAISKASELLGRPVDLVDLDEPTPLVCYLLGSGELVRVE